MNGRTVLGALALVVIGLLTWELRWVLLVLFGAVVLAVALEPVLALRLSSLARQVDWLPDLEQQLMALGTWERLQPLGGQLLGLAGGAANTTIQMLLMALLAILLALDPRSHQKVIVSLTPSFWRPQMQKLLGESRQALGGWLAGMTLSAVSVFLLTWAGLALLGVPLALLSALVCGLLTFVPTIGPTAATLLPLAVGLLVSPAKMLQVLVLRLILQNAEAFLLTPVLLRRTVNLLPTVALTAQLCLGALLGLPGVLLALPLVVVLQVLFEEVLVKEVMDHWN